MFFENHIIKGWILVFRENQMAVIKLGLFAYILWRLSNDLIWLNFDYLINASIYTQGIYTLITEAENCL